MNIIFSKDNHKMEWFRKDYGYAEVLCPENLGHEVIHEQKEDTLKTKITFTNKTSKPIFTAVDTIGIRFPLNDRYEGADICITSRCHAHIFCGNNVSYIMALRMGGEAPHFGMTVTNGSLVSYSIERDFSKMSNDRGCFILHPAPVELNAGESFSTEWVIFPHEGKDDFYKKLADYGKFIEVSAERYVMHEGETNHIYVKPAFQAKSVTIEEEEISLGENGYEMAYAPKSCGERTLRIEADGIQTWIRILVIPPTERLALLRTHFIAKNQQYFGKCESLNGAYLAYDNEESHIFYDALYDYNGGRERVGMGMAITKYLQNHKDELLERSLEQYIAYIQREIVDTKSGDVYNDIQRDDSYKRLYNLPWYAEFFVELYQLYSETQYLHYAIRIIKKFYADGGMRFYPIEMPILSLCKALKKEKLTVEEEEMKHLFTEHADTIEGIDIHYPASEVNYEQSIVAPAANILFQTYLLTKREKYLTAGKRHLEVLELFNGRQPDYHLHETAIRHWDGYWFGKSKLYGDTFPHYWSGLTGNVFLLYAAITGDTNYIKKAEHSLRGVLTAIHEDGSASCAYLYPHSVNGKRADFADCMANDQDWALYFYLRYCLDFQNKLES